MPRGRLTPRARGILGVHAGILAEIGPAPLDIAQNWTSPGRVRGTSGRKPSRSVGAEPDRMGRLEKRWEGRGETRITTEKMQKVSERAQAAAASAVLNPNLRRCLPLC